MSSKLLCFHCCHSILSAPLHMPLDFKNGIYICEGNFCSIPCMKTYNLELNDSYKNIRFMHINSLSKLLYNSLNHPFAPRKIELEAFGGNLTINKFRKNASVLPHIKLPYPMKVIKPEIEIDYTLIRSKATNSINVQNEPIRLERKAPLKNHQHTLEETMGLFKT